MIALRSLFAAAMAAQVILGSSCSPREVDGFVWTDSGERQAFVQAGGFPEGSEGHLGAGRAANRYILLEAIAIGEAEALVVRISVPAGGSLPILRLAASPRVDGSEPIATGDYEPASGLSDLILPLPAGATLISLAVELDGGAQGDARRAGSADTESAAIIIESISRAPVFRGYERLPDLSRHSAGFAWKEASPFQTLEIIAPFAGLPPEEPGGKKIGLLLSYGGTLVHSEFRITAIDGAGAVVGYTLRARSGGSRTCLEPELFPADTRRIIWSAPAEAEIQAFKAELLDPAEAELAELGRILLAPAKTNGVDYSIYRWALEPRVLILDFRDYATQDRYLRRLAYFVEKAGFRGRLLSDTELAGRHAYNAHDYRCDDLAAFFEAARASGFPLLSEERALQELLTSRGLLAESGSSLFPGEGALLSISRESSPRLRRTLLVHESTHGIFFVDPAYRDFVVASWRSVDGKERWFWTTYLGWAAYDTDSEYLMANEFQAYLLQQPLDRVKEYFTVQKAGELVASRPALKPKVEAYMAEFADSFAVRAHQIGSWLEARYGYSGQGAVALEPFPH